MNISASSDKSNAARTLHGLRGRELLRFQRILTSPAAAAAPPLLLALCLGLWAADVPDWDEWIIWTETLGKLQAGAFGLADLLAQQNEQRNLAARLFGLLLYPVFHLNRLAECILNIALAGLSFLLAARLYRHTRNGESQDAPLAVFSLFTFSLLQWESFSVGVNSSVLLPSVGMWAGACLLARPGLGWGRVALLTLTGILPSFSFVNGLFFWPCLAPVVFLRATGSQRTAKTMIFLLAGAGMWAAYFYGYTPPPHHPATKAALARPDLLAGYLLAYLGGAVTGDRNLLFLAIAAGAALLGMLGLCLRAAWRMGELSRIAPWLPVAAFSLLSALATAVGRSGFGLGQALESRYATYSSPLWIVVAALLGLLQAVIGTKWNLYARRTLAGCLALFLLSSILAAIVLRNHGRKLETARAELFRCTAPQKLLPMFPDPVYVMRALPIYLDSRAAFFRHVPLRTDCVIAPDPAGSFSLRPSMDATGRQCGYLVSGAASAGRLVLLSLPEGFAAAGQAETDGSFALFVPDSALPAGDCLLTAFSLEPGGVLRPLLPLAGISISNSPCPAPALTIEKHFHFPHSVYGAGMAKRIPR